MLQRSSEPSQYLSIRYSERLADIEAAASVGSKGDSYDNALAESTNGLYKAECVGIDGPFRTVGQVELATASWVEWFNADRLHSFCGNIPPEEYEAAYYAAKDVTDEVA